MSVSVIFAILIVGLVFIFPPTHDFLKFAHQTHLAPSAMRKELNYRKEEKSEQERLDAEFASLSKGAKFLLDAKEYSHDCIKKNCPGRLPHIDPFARSFAHQDYVDIVEDNAYEENIKSGNFSALIENADLLEPYRMQRLSRRYHFDIGDITDDEWELIHQEYNNEMMKLLKGDNTFREVLSSVKENHKGSLNAAVVMGEEQKKVSSMKAEDLQKEMWTRAFDEI